MKGLACSSVEGLEKNSAFPIYEESREILVYKTIEVDELFDESVEVPKSDMYEFYLQYCAPSSGEIPNDLTFFLQGDIEFINPYGHLPGQYFFFMPVSISQRFIINYVTSSKH